MKNVIGGFVRRNECWDCGETLGVYCTSVTDEWDCWEPGGTSGVYLSCSNGTTTRNFGCEIGA
jgi:hypothetical protein